MLKEKIIIYTDGAYSRSRNVGGYAFIAQYLKYNPEIEDYELIKESSHSATVEDTTSNRMELQAMIDGLNFIKRPCNVEIISDSTYCTNTINKWLYAFIANPERLNYDLMIELHKAVCRMKPNMVAAVWVRGHSGNPINDRVNELAQIAAGTFKPKKGKR
jgi:ribonuclease HI